jgi:plastocyanin
MRKTILVLMLGLALVFAVAACGGDDDESSATTDETTTEETTGTGGEAAGTTLLASVGPGFDISLTTEDGEDVTTLAPGTYTIRVDDKSDQHNFHLTGAGGVDVTTGVSEVGTADWELDLQSGSYEFVCDPHASSMNGSFEVSG